MIRSFRGKLGQRIFERQRSPRLDGGVERVAYRRLLILDAAVALEDLRPPPGNRLEKLVGGRRGPHSIRINDQWRICFRWREGNAYDVEVVDYH